MSDSSDGSGIGRFFQRLAVGGAIFIVTAGFFFLLSDRNSRTFALEEAGGQLRVLRGRMLPAGHAPFAPVDSFQAQAYAPIPVLGPVPKDSLGTSFADRDELDRRLFRILKTWIEPRAEAAEHARLAEAVTLLRRMELLTGIEDGQRRELKELQARVAYFEARSRLDEAAAALRDAVGKLLIASEGQTRHSRDAGEMYERVAGLAEQLARALRVPLGSADPGDAPEAGGEPEPPADGESAAPAAALPGAPLPAEAPPASDSAGTAPAAPGAPLPVEAPPVEPAAPAPRP